MRRAVGWGGKGAGGVLPKPITRTFPSRLGKQCHCVCLAAAPMNGGTRTDENKQFPTAVLLPPWINAGWSNNRVAPECAEVLPAP